MENKNAIRLWSFIGTYLVLLLIAVKTGAIDIVLKEMPLLFSGAMGMQEVANSSTTFLMMLEAITAVIAMHVPLVYAVGVII